MYRETHARSLLKDFAWRIAGTGATTAIVFGFTHRVDVALVVAGVDLFGAVILYFCRENRLREKPIEPTVVWFTGLSGAGKTAIAQELAKQLRSLGLPVEHLDGDLVREIFPRTGFSRDARNEHVKRVGFLASRLERNRVFVVASLISPYKESREFVRNLCTRFVEVYVSTPLAECEKRDPKGLYQKARRGEIRNFTGVDDPYEVPEGPDLTIDNSEVTVEEAVKRVMELIRNASFRT